VIFKYSKLSEKQ